MRSPMLLIAEREFRAYVATASFWLALVVTPLALAGAAALSRGGEAAAPAVVAVSAEDSVLAKSGAEIIADVSRLEGHAVVVNGSAPATVQVEIVRAGAEEIDVRIRGPLKLSPSGQALIAARIGALAAGAASPTVRVEDDQADPAPMAGEHLGRLGLVAALWLVLTGSLGMLLQAVVRERGNRGLELLLAASRAWEITFGKLLGVGMVSLVVLAAWLAGGLLAAGVAGPQLGLAAAWHSLADPWMLLRALVAYGLAFAFYGLITIALGAGARDNAVAQNMARPLFAMLLAVFFTSLNLGLKGGPAMDWLVYLPPFTPFILILAPHHFDPLTQIASLIGLLLATSIVGRWAIRGTTLTPVNPWNALIRRRKRVR